MAFICTVGIWSQKKTVPRTLQNSTVAFKMQNCILKYTFLFWLVFREESSIYPYPLLEFPVLLAWIYFRTKSMLLSQFACQLQIVIPSVSEVWLFCTISFWFLRSIIGDNVCPRIGETMHSLTIKDTAMLTVLQTLLCQALCQHTPGDVNYNSNRFTVFTIPRDSLS